MFVFFANLSSTLLLLRRISAPASELDFLDVMMDPTTSSPTSTSSSSSMSFTTTAATDSSSSVYGRASPRGPRGGTGGGGGTTSLRRKAREKERSAAGGVVGGGRASPATQSSFPITNGSLYSDLSLNRKVSDAQRAKQRRGGERDSFNLSGVSSGDLDSFDNPLDASQHSLGSASPHPGLLYCPSPHHGSILSSPNPSPLPAAAGGGGGLGHHQSSNSSISSQASSSMSSKAAGSNNCSLSTSLPLEVFGLNSTNDR